MYFPDEELDKIPDVKESDECSLDETKELGVFDDKLEDESDDGIEDPDGISLEVLDSKEVMESDGTKEVEL